MLLIHLQYSVSLVKLTFICTAAIFFDILKNYLYEFIALDENHTRFHFECGSPSSEEEKARENLK